MRTPDVDRAALLARLFGDEPVPPGLETDFLRTREVALAFQVSERTIAEWARRGRIPSIRTPGGHRLYPAERIREILRAAERGGDRAAPGPVNPTREGPPPVA